MNLDINNVGICKEGAPITAHSLFHILPLTKFKVYTSTYSEIMSSKMYDLYDKMYDFIHCCDVSSGDLK